MLVFTLFYLALSGSVLSQELFDDYVEEGAVKVIEDDPDVDVDERQISVFQPFVDEETPKITNLTWNDQLHGPKLIDVPQVTVVNSTHYKNQSSDVWDDNHCGYLMLKFLALASVLAFLMMVILLMWYSCSTSPHQHKFPTQVVVTPNKRSNAGTPGRNYSRLA